MFVAVSAVIYSVVSSSLVQRQEEQAGSIRPIFLIETYDTIQYAAFLERCMTNSCMRGYCRWQCSDVIVSAMTFEDAPETSKNVALLLLFLVVDSLTLSNIVVRGQDASCFGRRSNVEAAVAVVQYASISHVVLLSHGIKVLFHTERNDRTTSSRLKA
jgi:hypothetical protein